MIKEEVYNTEYNHMQIVNKNGNMVEVPEYLPGAYSAIVKYSRYLGRSYAPLTIQFYLKKDYHFTHSTSLEILSGKLLRVIK